MRYLTSILFTSNHGIVSPLCFLLDSGAELNVVKLRALSTKVKASQATVSRFSGINEGHVYSLGYIRIPILNMTNHAIKIKEIKLNFYPVSNFAITEENPFKNADRLSLLKSLVPTNHLNYQERDKLSFLLSEHAGSFFLPNDVDFRDLVDTNGSEPQGISTNTNSLNQMVKVIVHKQKVDNRTKWYYALDIRVKEFEMFESFALVNKNKILKMLGYSVYMSIFHPAQGFNNFTYNIPETIVTEEDFAIAISGLDDFIQLAYFGRMIIFSESLGLHVEKLKEIFETSVKIHVKFNPKISSFFLKNVVYLGHMVRGDKIFPNLEITNEMIHSQVCSSLTELDDFVCQATYLGRFVKRFQSLIKPLEQLLKENLQPSNERLKYQCDYAISNIKNILKSDPTLNTYDSNATSLIVKLIVEENVLETSLRRVIGTEEVIIFLADEPLSPTDLNVSCLEKELMCMRFALRAFYPFILDKKIIIQTNNRSINWLLNCSDLNPVYADYRNLLEEFNFEISYLPKPELTNIRFLQKDLDEIIPIKKIQKSRYFIKKSCKEPTMEEIPVILYQGHVSEDKTHFGRAKTFNRIRDGYNWTGIHIDIVDYIERCKVCNKMLNPLHLQNPTGEVEVRQAVVPFF